MRIFQANSQEEIEQARALFEEYQTGLGISLCFQNFDQELKNLPGDYAPPDGRLLLATDDDWTRRLHRAAKTRHGRLRDEAAVCSIQRIVARGLGRTLVESLIDEARRLGYKKMRLDTLPGRMDKAIALYRSIGFIEIDPYYENPVPDAKFMELELVTH